MSRTNTNDEFIRKRVERQRRIRKRRLIIFFIFFIFTLICTGIALSLTVFFPIEKINISGSSVYEAKQIEAVSGIEIGDNLFVLSKSGIENKLRKQLPYIETITLKRELPGTINITVTDADEFAVYMSDSGYYTVSKSGWVLNRSNQKPENLFYVTGADIECEIGSEMIFLEEKQKEILTSISDSLSKKKITTDYININDITSLKIGVEGRFSVELGNANNLEEKINHLSGMLKNIGETRTGKINLSMWQKGDTKGTFVEGKLENSSS